MQLHITQIGEPKTIVTKFGPKEKNWLKATEHGDKFLNYWCGESTKGWQVGATIEVESVEKRDYTGKDGTLKTSFDIKLPRTGFGEILEQLDGLRKRVYALEMGNTGSKAKSAEEIPYPTPESEGIDLTGEPPF